MDNSTIIQMATTQPRAYEKLAYALQTMKFIFYVEGGENADKVYYNRVIRQKLAELLSLDFYQLPVEVNACGSYRDVWKEYNKKKTLPNHFYIIDADFNIISKNHKDEYATFKDSIDNYKIFITCGYSIENYGNNDNFVALISKILKESVNERAIKTKLDSFILNIQPITIIQYLCFVVYRSSFTNANKIKNILDGYVKQALTINCDNIMLNHIYNELTGDINNGWDINNFTDFQDIIQKLQDNPKLDWIKYTRGKSILAFFNSYNNDQFNSEEKLIRILGDHEISDRLRKYLEIICELSILSL